jgi:hypothetical protein
MIISGSHDSTLKSWYTTPRHPAAPAPPRVVSVTHNSAMLSWSAPPCFNLDITAFHLQYRVGVKESWKPAFSTNKMILSPEDDTPPPSDAKDEGRAGFCIAPHLRAKTIPNLVPATYYQFRLRAENRMGLSEWSQVSPLVALLSTLTQRLPCADHNVV